MISPCRVSAGASVAPVRGQPRSRLAAHYLTLPCVFFSQRPCTGAGKMASCLFKHPPSTAQPPSPSRPISAPAPAPPRSLTARLTARARNPALPAQPQPIPASHAPLAQAQENGISPIRTPAPACPATLATPPDLRSSPSTASIPHRTADSPRSRNPACLPDHSPSPASAAAWSLCAHRHMHVTGDRGGVRSPPLTSLI